MENFASNTHLMFVIDSLMNSSLFKATKTIKKWQYSMGLVPLLLVSNKSFREPTSRKIVPFLSELVTHWRLWTIAKYFVWTSWRASLCLCNKQEINQTYEQLSRMFKYFQRRQWKFSIIFSSIVQVQRFQ